MTVSYPPSCLKKPPLELFTRHPGDLLIAFSSSSGFSEAFLCLKIDLYGDLLAEVGIPRSCTPMCTLL